MLPMILHSYTMLPNAVGEGADAEVDPRLYGPLSSGERTFETIR